MSRPAELPGRGGAAVAGLRVLWYAAVAGLRDYGAVFRVRSWLFGWYLRVVAQVAFFALLGRVLGSPGAVRYLLVGNAVALASLQALGTVQSTTMERRYGTLPLLVASPSSPLLVLAGRSLYWIPDAVASSTGALLVVGPLFGLPLPWPAVALVPPLVLVVALSTYALGLVLGGVALRVPGVRNLISNVTLTAMLAICGVNVPVSFFPAPVRAVAGVLPLTHGLRAVRGVLAGAGTGTVMGNVALEVAVGAGWLMVSLVGFDRLLEGSRRRGGIDLGAV